MNNLRFKTLFSLFIAIMLAPIALGAQRIAVLEFKAGAGVTTADVNGISSIFTTYFNPNGYTLVERSQIDKVISEQNFQQSSMTEAQMVRVGKILNLTYIVIGDINYVMGEYNVDVRVVDVESGAIKAAEGAAFGRGSYREEMSKLAETLARRIAQKRTTSKSSDEIFQAVETMPQFPGGDRALYLWLGEHINYPEEAVAAGSQGRVVVKFVVKKDGSIGDVEIQRGVSPSIDKEAIRLVKSFPKFIPGTNNGQPVNVWFTLPITFKLQ